METPRRRSQNREEQAQNTAAQPAREENAGERAQERRPVEPGSAQNCIEAVKAMRRELSNAKKALMNSENCVVNRAVLQAQLDYLEENLPGTVRKAAEIVKAEETIRRETEESKSRILNEAQAQAQQAVSEANAHARDLLDQANREGNRLMEQANQEASACVEAARAEAARMLEDAEKKARQMVEEESIVRRARVESDEIREKVQQETAQLRKNAVDFVDQQLMEADRSISEMLNAIRLERSEVRNRR